MCNTNGCKKGSPENRSCQIFSEFGFSKSKNLLLLHVVPFYCKLRTYRVRQQSSGFDAPEHSYDNYITVLSQKQAIDRFERCKKKNQKVLSTVIISIRPLRIKRDMHVIIVVGRNATTVRHQTPLTRPAIDGVKRRPETLLPNDVGYI